MTRLRAEIVIREIRTQARSFCLIAHTCPHISRIECTKCFRYYPEQQSN